MTGAAWVAVLVDEFNMCPEAVMGMPFRRFLTFQKLAFTRSVERKNSDLAAPREFG